MTRPRFPPTRLLPGFAAALAVAPLLALAPPALAQDQDGAGPPPPPPAGAPAAPGEPVTSTPTYPSGNPGGGIPSGAAVNPFPGAPGPYAGAGPNHFYDPAQRIEDLSGRLGNLAPGQRASARRQLSAIRSDLAYRRSRHGGQLRDWDREFINAKLDKLVQQYPGLHA